MKSKDLKTQGGERPGIIALNRWARESGITPVTAWRFRKRGWLATVNICGRQYVTLEEVARFTARAAAGEFAREHAVPKRSASQSFIPAGAE